MKMPTNQSEDNNEGIDRTNLLTQEIDEENPLIKIEKIEKIEVNVHESHDNEENLARNDGPGPRPKPKGPSWKGEHAKSIVYGGLDAIVTCFSLISSISSGGRMSSVDVLVLGFANLVADGISMGFGDYVSSSTEKNMAVMEKDVTQWEVDNNAKSEMRNLVEHYRSLGMNPDDATTVVNIISKYKNIMVEEEMMGQKGIIPADQDEKPWKNGLVTFASFLIFGSAPLLSFIILIPFTNDNNVKFIGACIMSALALALLGLAKAKISGENYGISALVTISNGAIAAATAYGIGWALRNVAGLDEP
ncbi:hypothetical protein RND81_01G200100 [Saponaria officinalis]|uniref:Uncharacterized protein n=1 Tax=Saponaria officinalis TaxID=3572 RepID=A0AAW1NFX4_SAPOF